MALVEREHIEQCRLETRETGSVAAMLRHSGATLRCCGEQATLDKLNQIIGIVKPGIDMLWQRSTCQDPLRDDHTEDYISVIRKGSGLTAAFTSQVKLNRDRLRPDFERVIDGILDVNGVIDAEEHHHHVNGEIGRIYAYDKGWSFKVSLHYTMKRYEKMLEALVDNLPFASTIIFGKVHEYHQCDRTTEKNMEFFAYLD